MGKGTNTTTQTTSPNSAAMGAYHNLLDRASGVAATPYNPYGGDLTAGINAQQNLGIGNINAATNAGSPWFDYAGAAAHALTPADIERYKNPYTQNVVDATQAQFDRTNAQQQEGLNARAISQGALGGSRAKIASADMAYQQQLGQAPVIAGLYNQGYNNAVQTAEQQQGVAFQGAGVGANIQQAGLQGAGAQIGAGTLQQQAEQQRFNALYQQYQLAQAFPYQQTQWLAGIDTGVGSQMGGTSTTTAPPPNPLSTMLGLGVAGAGVAGGLGWKPFATAARGGRIEGYDAGGSVGAEPYGGVGWIPQMKIAGGRGAPSPPGMPQPPHPSFDPKNFAFPKSGVGNAGAGAEEGIGGEAAPLGGMSEAAGSFGLEGLGAGLEGIGSSLMSALPEGVAAALPFLMLQRGGAVRGYADGGAADDDEPMPDTPASNEGGIFGGLGFRPVDWPASASGYASRADDGSAPINVPMPQRRPAGFAPPPSYDEAPVAGVGAAPAPQPRGFDMSSLSLPLITAGLGMMASRSPHLGVAIGEGGLQGVQAYAEAQKQGAERALAEKKQALDARRLDQMAQQSREHLALQTRQVNETAAYHRDLIDVRKGASGRENDKYIGNNDEGFPVYLDSRTGKERIGATRLQGKAPSGYLRNPDGTMSPIKGGPQDPDQISAVTKAKTNGGTLPDETADWLAERVIAGDAKALTNLGRGAQGPDNIIKVQSLAARKAAERGMNANDILAKVAEQSGLTAQQRTFGTQVARMAVNSTEAEGAIQQGLEVSKQVPRGRFVPLNRLLQMAEGSISDPDLLEFRAANLAIVNTYARAISPTGTPTVHDKEEALKVVSEATSPEAYERVMQRMLKEIAIAHAAPSKAKEELERIRKGGAAPAATAPAPIAASPLDAARDAIAKGAPRDAVIKRLQDSGIDPTGL